MRFVPDKGRNRIGAMVEGRPDWVLSSPARVGGADHAVRPPAAAGEYLVDPQVNDRIVAAVRGGWGGRVVR